MSEQLETAVILIAFNRPEPTRKVFQAIAAVKPKTLFLIADGPRSSRPGEARQCEEVRAIISQVNWPCDVHANFSDTNLGCQERISSGLDWAFDHVDQAIILEDDCLPDPTFFPFCHELLERYRDDPRIGMISGNNFVSPSLATSYSYYFARVAHIWGWATWRSAWKRFDRRLAEWPAVRNDQILRELFSREADIKYWTSIFDSMHDGSGPSSWAFPWNFTNLTNNRLLIVPMVNMVRNIGVGPDATHTQGRLDWAERPEQPIAFPLRHPPYVVPMRSFDERYLETCFVPAFSARVKRKLLHLLSHGS